MLREPVALQSSAKISPPPMQRVGVPTAIPAIFFCGHFVAMGAAQTWQQLSLMQGELRKVYGTPHQLAPATPPVHQVSGGETMEGAGGELDEKQRKSVNRDCGASVSDQLTNDDAGEGDGGQFNSPRAGRN